MASTKASRIAEPMAGSFVAANCRLPHAISQHSSARRVTTAGSPAHAARRRRQTDRQLAEAHKAARADLDPAALELRVAPKQRDQLTVDEAVFPGGDKGGTYQLLKIVERGHAVVRQGIELIPARKLLLEERANDLFLIAEVVVQVAGADAKSVGDMISRDRSVPDSLNRRRAVARMRSRVFIAVLQRLSNYSNLA